MNFKDKRMLIIGSGAFLLVLTFMLFFTLQSKDNMMSNTGRYSGDITLGDTIDHCTEYNWVLNDDNSGIKASCTAVPKNNSNDMYRTCMPAQDYECESAGINTGVCYVVAEFNKSGCKTCEAGTYLSNGVCVNCSPGFYCKENSQYYCPAGSYNPDSNGTSSDSCLPCSGENEFSVQGAVRCSSCGAGNPANFNHTGCTNPTSTGCNPGYWMTENHCEKCPTGSYCPDGQSKFQCYGNLISTEQGNVACNSRCSVGKEPNSEHTACEACKTNEVSPDGSACVVCPAGQEPNSNQTECICSDNTQIKKDGACYNVAKLTCNRSIQKGEAIEAATCDNCTFTSNISTTIPAGSNKAGDFHYEARANSGYLFSNGSDTAGCYASISCPYGQEISNGICTKSTNKIETIWGQNVIAIAADVGNVTGIYRAKDANGNDIFATWEVIGETDGVTVQCDGESISCSIKYTHQGTNSCGSKKTYPKIKATDSSGNSYVLNVEVYHYCKWVEEKGNYTFDNAKEARDSKRYTSGCYAYEGMYVENNKYHYTTRYDRCCGCGGGGSESPKCYVKADSTNGNSYCTGTSSECSGYRVSGKSVENCDKTIACYINNITGLYVSGDYENVDDYTPTGSTTCPETRCYRLSDGTYSWTNNPGAGAVWISSLENKIACEEQNNPTEEYKCYVNKTTNDYQYETASPGTGYEPDDTINNPGACTPAERPGCYINTSTGSYDWGLYEKVTGYVPVPNVDDDKLCKKPDAACYISKIDNKHYWGNYENNTDYTPVPGIDDDKKCNDTIPDVPKTDLNPSMIIYISVIVLCSFGMAFAVYAYRRQERNVN